MSPAIAEAYRRADEMQRQVRRLRSVPHVEPLVLPPPVILRQGLAHRPAVCALPRGRPVVVLRPAPTDDLEIAAFVREEFREAARKRDRR